MNYLVLIIFAFLGGITRYQISVWFTPINGFPIATLIVNLLGCFLLVLITNYIGRAYKLSPILISSMGSGFVGAMTTFSTFSNETLKMLINHQYLTAIGYDGLSLIGGVLISLICIKLSAYLLRRKG
ncbi:fluoride efflux transporter FluC [Lentilactobacillus laojiaonis]|uniref:fluoride efflux transporter FluC n=1 Tax=Lentilactobacillus laojiaonis TaxID=2883998 RepID=UPI001D0B910F|nr:CrcB family protein [Lentilactobacillus laojiaonis]UDM32309.1 CrcB family protein [Lentilactobacillus laojiaonis]